MTPTQARHLLALIADLYALASAPEPKPGPPGVAAAEAVQHNSKAREKVS